jgi:hypothetical protein
MLVLPMASLLAIEIPPSLPISLRISDTFTPTSVALARTNFCYDE